MFALLFICISTITIIVCSCIRKIWNFIYLWDKIKDTYFEAAQAFVKTIQCWYAWKWWDTCTKETSDAFIIYVVNIKDDFVLSNTRLRLKFLSIETSLWKKVADFSIDLIFIGITITQYRHYRQREGMWGCCLHYEFGTKRMYALPIYIYQNFFFIFLLTLNQKLSAAFYSLCFATFFGSYFKKDKFTFIFLSSISLI